MEGVEELFGHVVLADAVLEAQVELVLDLGSPETLVIAGRTAAAICADLKNGSFVMTT